MSDNLPKIHPRTQEVTRAKARISVEVWQIVSDHGLTYGEVSSILASILASFAKYQIRDERHPDDPDKPGDTE